MTKKLTTVEKLDLLADYKVQQDLLQSDRKRLIDEAIPAEVKSRIAEIDAEIGGNAEVVASKIALLEAEIKQEVKESGVAVKGAFLHAIFVKGRVSWDSKKLEGMMAIIPSIKEARSEGEPSVTLKASK